MQSHRSQSYLLLSCSFPWLTKVMSHSLFLITFDKYMYNYNMIGLLMPGEVNLYNETLVTQNTAIPHQSCFGSLWVIKLPCKLDWFAFLVIVIELFILYLKNFTSSSIFLCLLPFKYISGFECLWECCWLMVYRNQELMCALICPLSWLARGIFVKSW